MNEHSDPGWMDQIFFQVRHSREQRKFDQLYRKHSAAIYRRLVMSGSQESVAEEAVNEAFIVYWETFYMPIIQGEMQREPPENPLYWLMRVARNKAVDAYRRQVSQEAKAHDADWQSAAIDHEDTYGKGQIVRQVLAQLEEREVELLIGRDVEGLSYDELATQLDLQRGSVGTILRRARQAFAEAHRALLLLQRLTPVPSSRSPSGEDARAGANRS